MKSQKSSIAKKVNRNWHQVDASKNSLGRVATEIANLLRGKIKRDFTPFVDMGDFVVAINVDKLKTTGRKLEQKKYYHHSGYLGGLRVKTMKDEMSARPEMVLRRAVFSMLDDVKFRKAMMARLKLVKGAEHNFSTTK